MGNKLREERAKIGHALIVNNLGFIQIHKKKAPENMNLLSKPAIKRAK